MTAVETMQRIYLAVIEQGDYGYGVFFPDLPGCISAGDTIEDAIANASIAANAHVVWMMEDGDEIPPSTGIAGMNYSDPETKVAATTLVVVDGVVRG